MYAADGSIAFTIEITGTQGRSDTTNRYDDYGDAVVGRVQMIVVTSVMDGAEREL